MKAFITVIDDNGKVICKDQVLDSVKEEIIDSNPDYPPIKEARFSFVVKQLVDSQNKETEDE